MFSGKSRLVLQICLSFALASCATVRTATYPPGFVYLDNTDVHRAMQEMAVSIDRIDELLNSGTVNDSEKQYDIALELDKLKSATEDLVPRATISSHRIITDNIARFRARVDKAKNAVQQDPPRYQISASLVEECLSCHIKNIRSNEAF